MRRSLRSLVPIGAALAAIALVPGSAAAKCRPSIGHPVRPGYLLIIDGEMRGEYQSAVRPPLPPSEEIASLTVVCPESQQVDAAAGARQMVVAVVTREGLPRVPDGSPTRRSKATVTPAAWL